MFKKTTTQLFFYGVLFVSGMIHSAADDDIYTATKPEFRPIENTRPHDPYGLKAEAMARHQESLKPKRIIPDEKFDEMLEHYKTDLPSSKQAEAIVNRLVHEHSDLDCIIKCIKNPDLFRRVKYPSRLLFVGPSGCGKTTAAKALAKHCGSCCVFVKGSTVGNTYQNSGATLIGNLFEGLLERPEESFVVILDEFMAIAQFVDDSKEIQQNKTAMALWQALDDCAQKRHICVIGTDNGDPKKLVDQLKTRFAHNIFEFNHMEQNDMVAIIKECLGGSSESYTCSDEFLTQLTQSVKHLSIREIEDLIEKSKMLAIGESPNPNPYAKVTEQHLTQIFNKYREPMWFEKVWTDRDKHVRNLVSARAVSLYMTLGGLGLQSSDSQYKGYGVFLAGLGVCMNHYWPRNEKEASDLPLFSTVSHLFAQHENRSQWVVSHEFNVQNSGEAKVARVNDEARANTHLGHAENAEKRAIEQDIKNDEHRKWEKEVRERDEERANEHLEHARTAEKRAEEQDEKADEHREWDKEVRLKEAIKQVAVDKTRDWAPHSKLDPHKADLEEKLKKVQAEQSKKEKK